MLEIAPGVYTGARLSVAVRDRIWSVLEDWFPTEKEASIVMVWQEPRLPGGQSVKVLGVPPVSLVEVDGMVLAMRPRSSEVSFTTPEESIC
jgi:CRISPR-associated protein Cas2